MGYREMTREKITNIWLNRLNGNVTAGELIAEFATALSGFEAVQKI